MSGSSSPTHPLAYALRDAFERHGITPGTATLLLDARAAGLDWEHATTAVADGLHMRRGPPASAEGLPEPQRRSVRWFPVLLAIGAYVVLRPLMGLGHEVAVTLLAYTAHAVVGTGWWIPIINSAGLDPVYTGAAVRALGGVDILGLAVAAPTGDWLHSTWPALFRSSQEVGSGAGVSMVAAPGTPALGRGLASFGADVVWLMVGLVTFWSWRRRAWPVALIGLLVQAQIVVNHLFGAAVGLPDLEASGLPYAIAIAAPGLSDGAWFTAALADLPVSAQEALIGATLLVFGYASALLPLMLMRGADRFVHRCTQRASRAPVRPTLAARRTLPVMAMSAALAVMVALSPIGAIAVGQPNWQSNHAPELTSRAIVPGGAGRLLAMPHETQSAGPSVVRVEQQSDGSWRYLVDGQPTVLRGVGYNPQYAALSVGDRQQFYQRDFSAMRGLGINTVEGWFEAQFDSLTLEYAARNGIGVLMPFEINQDWDLTNVNVRQSILAHVSTMVERYKSNPAVRMWAPGNENMHRVLYPRWVSQENDPAARARADAFAAFLPVLVDRIHELDANHPVLYRDAEDVYLSRLKSALESSAVQRPWLVYGANVYSSSRLQEIVARWPSQWVGGPLVISEFAPGGAGRADRPLGFQQDWLIIRSRPDVVIGGLAYTWSTNGPEELDRVFGLVDPVGVPTDGALAALSAAYFERQ